MGNQNSLLSFYTEVYLRLHQDVAGAIASTSRADYERDRQEIANRARSEGLGFFTKTLPRFGKSIDKALAVGEPLQISGFRLKSGSQLPLFLGTLVRGVFDDTGRERSDACPMVLGQLRQLAFIFYKLELPYDEETANQKIDQFVETDANLGYDPCQFDETTTSILRSARNIVTRVMSGVCPLDIYPKHGPGAVATGERTYQKRTFARLVRSIDRKYPFTEYFRFNLSHVTDTIDEIQSLEELDTGTAKVVLVPKDSRGPRIISCEPLENQWIQQGQASAIVRHLESYSLTRGHVNFTDQFVNRDLAMTASQDGSLCTLDMKEASDRVSLDLVQHLFPKNWFEALYASRSDSTRLPDGTVMPMNKFAPMGSAVCFPVEALVFWALCVSIVMHTRESSLAEARKDLYVYGDDIICSSVDQAAIRHYLPLFGLKVNDDKSCTQGFFRESCGCDAYKGIDVTPLKISTVWCPRLDAGPYESYVAYVNALQARKYYSAARYLENRIQMIRPTPYTTRGLPLGIAFHCAHATPQKANRNAQIATRVCQKTGRYQGRGWRSRPSYKRTAQSGWDELLRVTTTNGWRVNPDEPLLNISTEMAGRRMRAALWLLRTGARIDDVNRALNGYEQDCVEAQLYTVPHSNRLQRGWITLD